MNNRHGKNEKFMICYRLPWKGAGEGRRGKVEWAAFTESKKSTKGSSPRKKNGNREGNPKTRRGGKELKISEPRNSLSTLTAA